MNGLIWVIIGLFVGNVFGYFIASLMMMGKVSDLEYELIMVRENKNQVQEAA